MKFTAVYDLEKRRLCFYQRDTGSGRETRLEAVVARVVLLQAMIENFEGELPKMSEGDGAKSLAVYESMCAERDAITSLAKDEESLLTVPVITHDEAEAIYDANERLAAAF